MEVGEEGRGTVYKSYLHHCVCMWGGGDKYDCFNQMFVCT